MIENNFLENVKKLFEQMKEQGEKAIAQIPDEKLFWLYNPETNSICIIVKHVIGNMLSRFSDFLHSDGEKSWRNRDNEFENEIMTRKSLMEYWNTGWECLFTTLDCLGPEDLIRNVKIRNENHTVLEALNRQIAHYSSHLGQIIFLGKMICGPDWHTLSIKKGESVAFNVEKGL